MLCFSLFNHILFNPRDTFIDPSMRPVHPLVNQEVFQALFCFGKFGHAEAVDAQDQPTAEMLAIAYQTYKQNALKKYFKAWQLFLIIAETRRAYKHNLYLLACDHWRLKKQLTIFLRWRDWTRWAVNRKELASTLLRNVLNQLTAKMALYFWKLVAMRARQIRELNSGLIGDNVQPKGDATMDEDVSDYEFGKTEAFHVTEKHKDPIKSLPNFIQRKLFSLLDPVDVANCACVCRAWMEVTEQMFTESCLNLSTNEKLTNGTLGRILRRRQIHLRQINLNGCTQLTLPGFQKLAGCRHLQDINLSRCTGLTDDAVHLLATGCQLLVYLNLSYTRLTNTAIRHLSANCSLLQYLSVAYCQNLTSECSQYFKQFCGFQQLIYLDLSGCVQIDSKSFCEIFSNLPDVKHWILNDLPVLTDVEVSDLICKNSKIETLELLRHTPLIVSEGALDSCRRADSIVDVGYRSWREDIQMTYDGAERYHFIFDKASIPLEMRISHKSLIKMLQLGIRRLRVSDVYDCEDATAEVQNVPRKTRRSTTERAKFNKSKSFEVDLLNPMKQLTIRNCSMLTDATILRLKNMPHLTVLNLSGCIKLTNESVRRLVEFPCAKQIRELYLSGCEALTDRIGHFIGGKLPKLTYFSLAQCGQIGDGAIEALVQCKQLWQVNISHTSVGDEGIMFLGSLPRLRELKIADCVNLTNVGLEKFAKRATQLECMSISCCHKITDAGLKALVRNCRLLQWLELAGCYELTDKAVHELATSCPYLQRLDLSACVNITDASLSYLQRGCKRMRHLTLRYCKSIKKSTVERLSERSKLVEHSMDEPPEHLLPPQPTEV